MAEYKITKISQQKPREWEGQHGTVYYIKTMLEGHERAVEIGKKSPDALKVGDTVYGTIQSKPQFDADGFKAESKPFGGTGRSSGGSTKDEHAIAKAVALKAAVDLMSSAMTKDTHASAAIITGLADEFLAWLEGGSESTGPKVTKTSEFDDPLAGITNEPAAEEDVILGFDGQPISLEDIPF